VPATGPLDQRVRQASGAQTAVLVSVAFQRAKLKPEPGQGEMISSFLEHNLRSASSALVSEAFIWATLAVMVLALYEASKGKHSHFLEYAPTLMTSLGILGTFAGVVIGLVHFDTEKIDDSIPELLGGLKTAFLTSVFGMATAMLFNFLDAWKFAPKRARNGEASPQITPKEIHAALQEQNAQMKEVLRCLGGDSDGSLIGQIKLLRSDFGDFTKESRLQYSNFSGRLWEELEQFAETLSKSATSQIIDALRQVILDFNKNLTEQFGENFKRLDESVQQMVIWQTQYKDHVEKIGEQYQQSVESLVATRQAVAGIWEECKEIPLAMAELKSVLVVNQHQIQELQRHLQAFVTMRNAAVEAVPILQQKIEEIAVQMLNGAEQLQAKLADAGARMLEDSNRIQETFSQGAEQVRDSVVLTQQTISAMSQDVAATATELKQSLQESITRTHESVREAITFMQLSTAELGDDLKRHSADLSQQHKSVLKEVELTAQETIRLLGRSGEQLQQSLSESMQRVLVDLVNVLNSARASLDASFKQSIKDLDADVNTKLRAFEDGTMRELERELETVGRALTSITSRFVSDYDQLIARMNEVLRNQPSGRL
jgi:hypothetical protein